MENIQKIQQLELELKIVIENNQYLENFDEIVKNNWIILFTTLKKK